MNSRSVLALVALAAFALATPAFAISSKEILGELAKCAENADATQRLACYDTLSPQLRQAVAAMKKPSEQTEADKTSFFGFDVGGLFGGNEGPTTPEQFGKNQMPPTQEEENQILESISASVTEYSMTPFGKFIVFLDNGQIWRQLDSDTSVSRFHGRDNKVVISRGIFGSYNLKLNDSSQIYKVKRIR
jgi:hypothetical protein